ncbi:DUF3108 domain-containing protein [Bacteroidales bacterium OttesenSCG-928-C19]|nr:DUF3108 domain-containing protein [Bacteroidales bacterium OttesenSCG-928-C19]
MKNTGKICLWMMFIFASYSYAVSQQSLAMTYGESITYDIYFKWGPIMPRAGSATFLYDRNELVAGASSCYRMNFKTTKFFDNIFKMRDTLLTYHDDNNKVIYGVKRAKEGDYYSVDELMFENGDGKTMIRSLRYTPTKVKIDTTLTAIGDVTDMLGAVFYLRGINRMKLRYGDVYPFTVAIGRDLVRMQFVYEGQEVIKHDKVKYNTHYFKIDIYDEIFENAKNSAEVWVSDDDNFFPVKARTKLKIGYGEIYYRESSNFAHPLKCIVEKK